MPTWTRPDLRLAIYQRDGWRCLWCGAQGAGVHYSRVAALSLDHAVPKSQGGSNAPSNLLTACCACNCDRGAQPLEDFAARLYAEGRTWGRPEAVLALVRFQLDLPVNRELGKALVTDPPPWLRYQRWLSGRVYRDEVVSGERDFYRRRLAEQADLIDTLTDEGQTDDAVPF